MLKEGPYYILCCCILFSGLASFGHLVVVFNGGAILYFRQGWATKVQSVYILQRWKECYFPKKDEGRNILYVLICFRPITCANRSTYFTTTFLLAHKFYSECTVEQILFVLTFANDGVYSNARKTFR